MHAASSPSSRLGQCLAAVALFVGAAFAAWAPATDGDVWWHLAAGREMVEGGALLRTDPFSVTALGRSWPDVHWLFQLGSYAVYQVGGLTLLVLIKCALVGLAALVAFAALPPRKTTRALFVPMFLAALFAARSLLLLRPVILTLLFLSASFWLLERHRRGGRARALVWLPLLQLAWVNCQGLSPLGPALIIAYALGAALTAAAGEARWFPFALDREGDVHPRARLRPLLMALGLTLAASFVTPYGREAVALPGKLLGRLLPFGGNVYAPNVAENVPPLWLEQLNPGQFTHFKWYLGLLALCFAVGAARIVLSHVLVVAGFLGLALMANRNVLLLYWMATPIVAMTLAPALETLLEAPALSRYRWAFKAASPVSVAVCLMAIAVAARREPTIAEPAPFRMPVQSARIIAALPGEGTIFSADHQGGYLIWQLYPRFRPFMDTRLVLRSPEEFADYLAVADEPERFDALQQQNRFRYVVLPVGYPDRYVRLIAHLYRSPAWMLVFTDGAEVLFARRDTVEGRAVAWDLGSDETTSHILAGLQARFGRDPDLHDGARAELASLDFAVGEYGQCERALAAAAGSDGLRARCRLAAGDVDGARELAEQMLQRDHDDASGLSLMAMVHARRGDTRQATGFLRRALARHPFDVEVTSLLASMEERKHANQ